MFYGWFSSEVCMNCPIVFGEILTKNQLFPVSYCVCEYRPLPPFHKTFLNTASGGAEFPVQPYRGVVAVCQALLQVRPHRQAKGQVRNSIIFSLEIIFYIQ